MKNIWRAIWFKDDDDYTPQGKLARGCFYIIYWAIGFLLLFGGIIPFFKWYFQ